MSAVISAKAIRPVAICIIRRGGSILVAEGSESASGDAVFYRPLGGGLSTASGE